MLSGRSRKIFTIAQIAFALCLGYVLVGMYHIKHSSFCVRITKNIFLILGISQAIACVFFLLDIGVNLLRRGVSRLQSAPERPRADVPLISRGSFLQLLSALFSVGFSGVFIAGFRNRYAYKIYPLRLFFYRLPDAFRGLKIIQISDIHAGSFTDPQAVSRGVDMINDQQADLIFFTGDLVNDFAVEMKDYWEMFARLHAKYGVFSVLGNHDYGDYVHWPTPEQKEQNFNDLKEIHRKMGWRLLLNECVYIHKDNQKIAIAGVENWSAVRRFSRYGDLSATLANHDPRIFTILLSHDPTHWSAQVLGKTSVDLTLSGHTHGMQCGVEVPFFKWSPVQYVYKHWAGLYTEGAQKLYVNRGFGFIGYQGRVGILPEISVIHLL